MEKAYIEPNVINWARRAGLTGNELRARLLGRSLVAHFGLHGIYELARGFLSETARGDIQQNFQIISELDPVFEPTVEMLYKKEVDLLRTGACVIPVLDPLNQASAKYQVNQMAKGFLEAEGERAIARREEDIDKEYPLFVGYQLEAARHGVGGQLPNGQRVRTIEDVFEALEPEVPGLIQMFLRGLVTTIEAKELHFRLNEFPAIRSAVRANLYLWAIPILNARGASHDKPDDYRHVIEASYADVFITGDTQLARSVPRINPGLRVITWAEIEAG